MNCHGFQKQLHEYLDEALSPSDQMAAQRHLVECSVCRAVAKREQEIARALSNKLQQSAENVVLDAQSLHLMAAAVERKLAACGKRTLIPFWPRFALPLAAAFVVIGVLAAHSFFSGRIAPMDAARNMPHAQANRVSVNVSYLVPTYTFLKKGDFVIDALTCDPQVTDGALLAKN